MKPIKIVVFDLDETLGYFIEFAIFWECLKTYVKKENPNYYFDQENFDETFDLFPEFVRPNIIDVLLYLKQKKQVKACDSVLIYTNNQATKEWAACIKNFFEKKINYNLFDQIIGAFKINGKKYELCRTSHEKTIHDLLKCSKLPANTEVCFLDDTLYPEMTGKNIYYIKVNPYIYNIPFKEMFQRFLKSDLSKKIILNAFEFENEMLKHMQQYGYQYVEKSESEYEIDKIVTKKTMHHLEIFFKSNWKNQKAKKNHTSKRKVYNRHKTFKKQDLTLS
jgi:hypothetical protein